MKENGGKGKRDGRLKYEEEEEDNFCFYMLLIFIYSLHMSLLKERKHEKHKFRSLNSKIFLLGSHASCKIYFYLFDFNDK